MEDPPGEEVEYASQEYSENFDALGATSSSFNAPASARTPRRDKKEVVPVSPQVLSVRALRSELRKSCKLEDFAVSTSGILGGGASHISSTVSANPLANRPCGCITTALEDRLKRRQAIEKDLANQLKARFESMKHSLYAVSQAEHILRRACAACWAAASVAGKRLDMREKIPEEEKSEDALQRSLVQEQVDLLAIHEKMAVKIEDLKKVQETLEGQKADMVANKLTLHLDRSDWPRKFLADVREEEEKADRFVAECKAMRSKSDEVREQSRIRTAAALKHKLNELVPIRRQLEVEIIHNRAAIWETEKEMEKMGKILREHRSAPEKQMLDEEFDYKAVLSRSQLDVATLNDLRNKIKGAAYTGQSGRQLDVLFGRFDRDGSGVLDEDEVRSALRRTLKIPPSVITDPEISALCNTLDADESGEVSIQEIVGFLNADVDVEALEKEFQHKKDLVDKLKECTVMLEKDLRTKTAAWKIDHSCRSVTAIKSLELDITPPSIRSGDAFGERRSKKPLERRVLERCRQKIRNAGETEGKPLEEVLAKFDRDKSGALEVEEFHRALRVVLKIPSFAVSDSEIISLFSMLDKDKTGSVGISEILDFISAGQEGAAGGGGTALEPIKTVDSQGAAQAPTPRKHGPRMSVTLLERTRSRLNDAAYQGNLGCSLEELFGRYDKDASGRLPDADFRTALRRGLKMPSSILADHEIHALCGMLDPENNGVVEIAKTVSFIGPDKTKSNSAGKRSRTSQGAKLEPISTAASRPGTTL